MPCEGGANGAADRLIRKRRRRRRRCLESRCELRARSTSVSLLRCWLQLHEGGLTCRMRGSADEDSEMQLRGVQETGRQKGRVRQPRFCGPKVGSTDMASVRCAVHVGRMWPQLRSIGRTKRERRQQEEERRGMGDSRSGLSADTQKEPGAEPMEGAPARERGERSRLHRPALDHTNSEQPEFGAAPASFT